MSLISLPRELVQELLLSMDTSVLLNFCSTNKEFRNLCNNEFFWQQKVSQLGQVSPKPNNLSWKQYFINLTNFKTIPIYIYPQPQPVAQLYVSYDDSISKLVEEANKLMYQNSDTNTPPNTLLFKDTQNVPFAVISNPYSPTLSQYRKVNPTDRAGTILKRLGSLSYNFTRY